MKMIIIIIIFANLFLIFHHGKMTSKEMANEWRTAVVACLVLFIMIEGAKPGLALGNSLETCIVKCRR